MSLTPAMAEICQREAEARARDEELRRREAAVAPAYVRARFEAMRDFHVRYLSLLLCTAKLNISYAAKLAKLDRTNFKKLLKRYKIVKEDLKCE